ncbi:DUF3040 domain-containing protein [Streptosporangium sp. NBC_01756]|uniref:DUF3040 domain-containing protein n=1 Tax=Streptosporangium sp. NBC_01756 TaxID=2975950 RepID=UPI002DD803E5|nr:DUF3040 domain-containing protein [Streptosporangium sp. NBC_01756]WSC89593.1 DUF3040 domain-containing protein [Streptosporangium sp. NBC_01756]
MRLSREEKRRLAEIEERLAFEDPELDAALARPPDRPDADVPTPMKTQFLLAVLVILVILFALAVLLTLGETICPGGPPSRGSYCGTGPETPVGGTGRLQ